MRKTETQTIRAPKVDLKERLKGLTPPQLQTLLNSGTATPEQKKMITHEIMESVARRLGQRGGGWA